MEAKINIAEILKDKSKGIRLYSPIFGECAFCLVREETDDICVKKHDGEIVFFDSKGLYNNLGEVMLFPSKEMREWSKFAWKKGDVLKNTAYERRVIFDGFLNDDYTYFKGKHPLDCSDKFNIKYYEECNCFTGNYRLESTDAAKTYINTLEKKLGGKLNREILEIEPAQPEFKDGDIIYCNRDAVHFPSIHILNTNYDTKRYYVRQVISCDGNCIDYDVPAYDNDDPNRLRFATEEERQQLFKALAKEGKAWDAEKKQIVDLKPKVELRPFDKVLVRDSKSDSWRANLFGYIDEDGDYRCVYATWVYCIPYEGNESLLGTTKDVEG